MPPNCTVVGGPGHIVKKDNISIPRNDLNQVDLPDPVEVEIQSLVEANQHLVRRIAELEQQLLNKK